jgi:hypothetical protein
MVSSKFKVSVIWLMFCDIFILIDSQTYKNVAQII